MHGLTTSSRFVPGLKVEIPRILLVGGERHIPSSFFDELQNRSGNGCNYSRPTGFYLRSDKTVFQSFPVWGKSLKPGWTLWRDYLALEFLIIFGCGFFSLQHHLNLTRTACWCQPRPPTHECELILTTCQRNCLNVYPFLYVNSYLKNWSRL